MFDAIRNALPVELNAPVLAHTLAEGTIAQAVLVAPLLLPEVVEVEGSILLLSEQVESIEELRDRFKAALVGLGSNPTPSQLEAVEKEFNFFDVSHAFVQHDTLPAGELDALELALAYTIQASWTAWLRYLFPARRIEVEIETDGSGSPEYIMFFERRTTAGSREY